MRRYEEKDSIFRRIFIQIKDKLFEETYKELYEKQNKLLDKNSLTITRQRKQIARLKLRLEKLEGVCDGKENKKTA